MFRHTNYRNIPKPMTGFSLVELLLSVVMVSIIAIGLSLALFHVKEKTQSYSVDLVSHQDYQTVLRQIAQDYRHAELIRFYYLDNKYFIIKNTIPAETVSYFLDANYSLIKYVNSNSVEHYETLLSPVTQLSFETDTITKNGIVTIRGLTIVLTIGLDNETETYTHTVSLLNHPTWDEVVAQSPLTLP